MKPPTPVPPATTPGPYPEHCLDAAGRQVTLATRPARIVSYALSVTEVLFATGVGPQVVGRTKFCNDYLEVIALPTICGYAPKSISIERILNPNSSLVVAGSGSQKVVVTAPKGAGMTVFLLAPPPLSAMESGFVALGDIVGNAETALSAVGSMPARTAAVMAKVGTIPQEKRL